MDEDNIASDSNATASDSNAEHIHTQECYALDCPHEREEHKVNGVLEKTITGWTFIDDDNYLTEGELAMTGVNAQRQADFDTVVSMLPTQILAELDGETDLVSVDITGWSCLAYAEDVDGNWPLTGEYTFTAELAKEYVCEPLPTVKVLIGGAELYGESISGEGYTFNPANSELTVNTDDGTTLWQKKISKDVVKKVTLNYGVTVIKAGAFYGCSNLFAATIPDSVQTIENEAFTNCVSLSGTLVLPKNLTSIGANAFAYTGFTSLDLSNATKLTVISGSMCMGSNLTGELVIPSNIESIGNNAFASTKITSLDLSKAANLGIIGSGAFSYITTLFTVKIPKSVTSIGEGAFQSTALTSADLSEAENLKVIGNNAFRDTEISSITIPQSVTNVGNFAFFDCSELTSVTFTRQSAPALGLQVFDGTSQNLVIHVPENASGYDVAGWPTDRVVEGPALPLTDLIISSGTLSPVFSMGQQNYTATVPATVASVTVTPSSEGTITVNGKNVTSGDPSEPIVLESGKDNKIEIVVTTNETLRRTYTVIIPREKAAPTLSLEASPTDSQIYPGSVTLTATLTGASGGNAGKTIQFTGSGTFTATTNESGVATHTFTDLTPGTYNFGASFAGDSGNNAATDKLEIAVVPRNIANVTVNVIGNRVYTGSQLQPNFEVKDGNIAITTGDYTVSYGINVDTGTDAGSITLNGQRNYTGTKTVPFDIEKRSLNGAAITLDATSYVHTGSEIKPAVISVVVDGVTVPAAEFDVGYANNTAIGTATVTITAKADGNFTGTASAAFEITRRRESSSSDDSSTSNKNSDTLHGTWVQTEDGTWVFRQTGGSYAKNRWGMVDGLWYFFDGEGKMLTGWQFLGGQWYYLYTKEDAAAKAGIKEGAMAVGWHFDPQYQKWFYFDASGAMVTGWREIDGKWHYFNPASDGTRGAMVTDSVIDGRYIDKNGVWNGN